MNASFATRWSSILQTALAAATAPFRFSGRILPATLSYGGAAWRAALLGILAATGMPPLTLVPLLLASIAGLLLVVDRTPHWRVAAVAGFIFGIGYFIAGLYWITEAIMVMADAFWWAIPIAVPLLSAVLALFIAAPCAVARLAVPGWPRLAVLAGGWTLGDLARQFVLSGFPWNLPGSTWEMPGPAGLVFIQPAAWIGVHGLTLLTILLAGSLTLGRRGRFAAAGFIVIWAACGIARLQLTRGIAQAPAGLTAVIVQGNFSEIDHRDHGGERSWAERVFDRHLALTRQGMEAAHGRPALVVWPETASPYALSQDPRARRALADAAAPALVTLAGAERFESRQVAHNSLIAVGPSAEVAGIYDKSHLVPFGEYFPPYAHFLLGEQGFVPGRGLRTLHLPGLPAIGPLICYEAIFPGKVVEPGDRPDILVNITNDAWFGRSSGPIQHLAAARMRSVEEGLPMLRAANTGISAVIDPFGRILARLNLETTGYITLTVPNRLHTTIFGSYGLLIPLLLSATSALMGMLLRLQFRRLV